MLKYYVFFMCLFALSCTRTEIPFGNVDDCEPDITYTDHVASIINKSCAYSGCHVDNTAPGNYNTYEGLLPNLSNGEFLKRTISISDMPPSYAPDDKPKELTSEEIRIISCWAENDYKQ